MIDQCLSSYDYVLPDDLIAQNPVTPRDISRLLTVLPQGHLHRRFTDLPSLLQPGDLLVMNNSKVIPARLRGYKRNASTPNPGSTVEVLLLEPVQETQWLALVKPGRRLKPGAIIDFGHPTHPVLSAEVVAIDPSTRGRILAFHGSSACSLMDQIHQLGTLPLPPYITQSQASPEQYQTVYAQNPGSVAAPTAGLHFTPDLLHSLEQQGIHHRFVTLHVGIGTFRPVEVEDITQHAMHSEWLQVPQDTVEAMIRTREQGGRIIAVGTTTVRALESLPPEPQAYEGRSHLFIYPGYRWRWVDGLITNFHLPRSSLLMLVSALIGRQRLLDLYQVAIQERYRFYSFGDAMLITPEANAARSQASSGFPREDIQSAAD